MSKIINTATVAAIEAAIAKFPQLTDFGFGVYDEQLLSPKERERQFAADRADMFTQQSLDGFARAREWLEAQPRTKRVSLAAGSSYGLKHLAERQIGGYITNGIFIAAAVAAGFTVERLGDTPDAVLNISRRLREPA
jgi:hypothetical protein